MNDTLLKDSTKLWFLRILNITFYSIVKYFTIWNLSLIGLYYLGILKNFQFSILLTTLLVSIVGFILVYIHPKYIYIYGLGINLKGKWLKITDLLFHHLPLLLFVLTYDNNIPKDNMYLFVILVIIYLCINNPFKIYNFLLNKKN